MKGIPATPVDILQRAYDIGQQAGLHFVYVGNLPGHTGNNTYCPNCHELLIERYGLEMRKNDLKDGKCPRCGLDIVGKWAVA